MRVLAIDPGTTKSGWVVLDGMEIVEHGISRNKDILASIRPDHKNSENYPDEMVLEMVACYGMPVGAEVFDTCVWIGRFMQRWETCNIKAHRLFRRDVKMWLCNSMKAKDANIRQAVINKYPPTGKDGKGNPSAIGTAKHKGPLYGIRSHTWQALALGITFIETRLEQQ